MLRFGRYSIKNKLRVIIMVITASALALAGAAFVTYHIVTFRDSMRQEILILARITGDNCSAAIQFDDRAAAEEVLRTLHTRPSIVSASIVAADGGLFAQFYRDPTAPSPSEPRVQEPYVAFEADRLTVGQPIVLSGKQIGTLWMQSDLDELNALVRLDVLIMFGLLIVSSLMAFALASRLQGAISVPILHLADTARQVSESGRYAMRASKYSEDEVGRLTDAFNRMLDEIASRDASLNEYRNHLEELVAHRTSELTEINTRLENEIVERKKIETALVLAKEEAEKANKMKSRFLANMTHELRTPMNSILGFSNLLKKSADAKVRDFAATIMKNGQRLMGLINDVLDISKIESGKTAVDMRYFPLINVTGIEDYIEPLIKDKPIALTVTVDPALPAILYSDEAKVMQIMINLAANAAKFTDRGYVQIMYRLLRADGFLELTVQDSGRGIRPEALDDIFEEFYQVAGEKQVVKGSGLGLSISRQLAGLLGGGIRAESEYGRGSAFVFTVPIMPPHGDAVGASEPSALILSADEEIQTALAEAFRRTGLKAAIVDRFDSLWSLAAALRPQIVLADGEAIGELTLPDVPPAVRLAALTFDSNGDPPWRVEATFHDPPESETLDRLLRRLKSRAATGTPVEGTVEPRPTRSDTFKRSGRLLVVEDEESNRKLLKEILTDYDVRLVEDGEQVLGQCDREKPDLILMDIMMPRMNGDTALAQLRQHEAYKRIPVIAVTAKAMAGDAQRYLELGFDDYLSKPIDERRLLEMITRHLSRAAEDKGDDRSRSGSAAGEQLRHLAALHFFESRSIKVSLQALRAAAPAGWQRDIDELIAFFRNRDETGYRHKLKDMIDGKAPRLDC